MNPFLIHDDDVLNSINAEKEKRSAYSWLISADKIFESEIEGFKQFARFFSMEFNIARFSLFNGQKSSDSAVCAKDVKINLPPSRFCAAIQENLANGKEIAKITLKRVISLNGKLEPVEEKEFSKCIIQSFERKEDVASFTFRCSSYSDVYQDFKSDGKKSGKASTKIDLATWKVG